MDITLYSEPFKILITVVTTAAHPKTIMLRNGLRSITSLKLRLQKRIKSDLAKFMAYFN
jgi:hypothetical protein